MREALLVFHVPAEGFEEWGDEIDAGLGFVVAFRKIVRLVDVEFFDEALEVARKGFDCRRRHRAGL